MSAEEMRAFCGAMQTFVPEHARILYSQFRGDPNADIEGKWRARVLRDPDNLDPYANIYVCVSAMQQNQRGEFRRRKENFAGGILLMIDDLGTGIGAKQPLDLLDALPPSALIETSPDNFQAIYLFDSLVEDHALFDALIRAFVHTKLLSATNSGMDGINRVFRPPYGVNGKPKYLKDGREWQVLLREFYPERRYSVQEIAKAYELDIVRENRIRPAADYLTQVRPERRAMFLEVYRTLKAAGMLKREEPNYSGWIDIVCPWCDEHSDGADNGASIRVPMDENQFYGAFRCHHGHCSDRGWAHLTDWIASAADDILSMVNQNAKSFEAYCA